MAMIGQPTDTKGLYLYSECDKGGTDLAVSAPAFPGNTMIIAGDLNHAFPHTVYPVVFDGSADQNYLVQWKDGPNYCPVGAPGVSGVINTTSTGCNLIDVYDLGLQGGMEYRLNFEETGDANIMWLSIRISTATQSTGGTSIRRLGVSNPITGYVFTAPASDVFGLVIFGKAINGSGTYSVEIERYDDCTPLPTESCVTSVGYPLDFSFDAGYTGP